MTDETRAPLPEIRRSEGYDQDALDAASREVHMMLLREGSSWGTKACEEMGRVFMTAYRKALPAAPVSTSGALTVEKDILLNLENLWAQWSGGHISDSVFAREVANALVPRVWDDLDTPVSATGERQS